MIFWNIKNGNSYIKDDVSINRVRGVQFVMNLRNSTCESQFERDKQITTSERTTFCNLYYIFLNSYIYYLNSVL